MQKATPEVLINLHALLGEGPLWDHRKGALAWVDIISGHVHLTDPDTGTTSTRPLGIPVGALALFGATDYLVAVRNGFGLLGGAGLEVITEVFDAEDKRMNDGAVDPAGRFLAGTMADGGRPRGGDLYVLDRDGGVRTLIEAVTISNGLAWSAEGDQLFYVDSATQSIDVLDYDLATGAVTNRRQWVSIPTEVGVPDGITMDADGCIWVALWGAGRVRRYSPAGACIAEIEFPVPRVTSCAFGGDALDQLYVTSAAVGRPRVDGELDGAVFVVDPGCQGRPEPVVPERTA